MTLQEFYSGMGVDYKEVMKRLLKEERVIKYLGMILKEPNFALLDEAYEKRDHDEIFKTTHTIKGLCMNLELKPLAEASAVLMEYTRESNRANIDDAKIVEYYTEIKRAYDDIAGKLNALL